MQQGNAECSGGGGGGRRIHRDAAAPTPLFFEASLLLRGGDAPGVTAYGRLKRRGSGGAAASVAA